MVIFCLLFYVLLYFPSISFADFYGVNDYGAVGDGITDDSQAFLKAWKATCKDTSTISILRVPAVNYLLNPVTFAGPCNPSSITVQINGNVVAPSYIPSAGAVYTRWLVFDHVNGLTVKGSGTIDDRGEIWWRTSCIKNPGTGCAFGPTQLTFNGCNNLRISSLKLINGQRNHLAISSCIGVSIFGITINAPVDSPNTDGIDIATSTNVQIRGSRIATGDDCIAVNTGTSNLRITRVICGPGHGISIGSIGKNNARETVEQIYIGQATISGTTNGARIKTWQGGSGYAKDITFEDIKFVSVQNPIIIDQYYCEHSKSCINQTQQWRLVMWKYKNIRGTTSSTLAVIINCSTSVACTNIEMDRVQIISVDSSKNLTCNCINAKGTASPDCTPTVNCLAS